MQKAIIASSMAVLASGVTVPHHQLKSMKTKMMSNVKNQMKGMQTLDQQISTVTSASSTVRTSGAGSALRGGMRGKGKGKGKGRDDDDADDDHDDNEDSEDNKNKHFEIHFGGSPTCDDHFTVYGFELGLCKNYVDKDENGYGLPRSLHFLADPSGGPGLYETFMNHGCMGTAAVTGSLNPEEVGFEAGYEVGTCVPIDGGQYYGKAVYSSERFEPTFDSVTNGYGVEHASCQTGSLFEYEITRQEACMEEEGEFFSYDLINCASGVVTYKSYSDNTCTTMTGSEEQKTNTCNFDLELFMETLADVEEGPPSGYFEYVSTLCQQAVA